MIEMGLNLEWRTEDEIDYIEGLGFHAGADKTLSVPEFCVYRLKLLYNYLASTHTRVNWEGLDARMLRVRVSDLIRIEEQELGRGQRQPVGGANGRRGSQVQNA